MARRVLRQLGRGSVLWGGMVSWEKDVVKELVKEVAGVPGFVVRLMEHLLEEVGGGLGTSPTGVQMIMNGEQ